MRSVLDQPYQNIRIILVNDGSRDGSPQICDRLAAESDRIHVIHKENGGVSTARNVGIEYALQEYTDGYIAFLDADDLWCPNAITDTFFDDLKRACDMCAFGTLGASQDLSAFGVTTTFQNEMIENPPSIVWEKHGHFAAFLYSARLFRQLGIRFNPEQKYSEDTMFLFKCLMLSNQVQRCSKWLYIYRYNSSSATHTRKKLTKINYYLPIINGWIKTSDFINSWEHCTGRTTNAGYSLASIYFIDMAAEHYQKWGSQKQLKAVLSSHPYYHLFLEMKESAVSKKQYREHLLMKNHHTWFRMKHNLIGIVVWLAEFASTIPFVFSLYMKRKFPLASMPENL